MRVTSETTAEISPWLSQVEGDHGEHEEVERIDEHANELNREAEEVLEYQIIP